MKVIFNSITRYIVLLFIIQLILYCQSHAKKNNIDLKIDKKQEAIKGSKYNPLTKSGVSRDTIKKQLTGRWEARNTKCLIVLTINNNQSISYINHCAGSIKYSGAYTLYISPDTDTVELTFHFTKLLKQSKKHKTISLPKGLYRNEIIKIGKYEYIKEK